MKKKIIGSDSLDQMLNKIYPDHLSLVNKAVEYSKSFHGESKRLSGKTLVEHGINVALNLADLDLDTNLIIAAILHHVGRVGYKGKQNVSKKPVEIRKDIKKEFGSDVSTLLTEFRQISEATKSVKEPEIINKFIFNQSQDLRVIFMRLADRLENARTINYLPKGKQKRFAYKLLRIYAPLANYLNIPTFREELENIGYKIIYPRGYIDIDRALKKLGVTKSLANEVNDFLVEATKEVFDEAVVFGRVKSYYSIHKKRKKYAHEGSTTNLNQFGDLLAFTILTENEDQCYKISSFLIGLLENNVLSYEDYIANPKPNGFREIQLVLKIPYISNIKIEVQIMTMEFYQYNTYGPASHFAYKSQETRYAKPSVEFQWVKRIRDKINESLKIDKSKRSRPMHSDIFSQSVFVWTPKKEILQLPVGATALDFAYLIHTDIGNNAVEAKIEGESKLLSTELKSGQTVKICTQGHKGDNGNVRRDWLKWCITDKAKDNIKKCLKDC